MVRFLTAAFVSMVLATAAFANPLFNPSGLGTAIDSTEITDNTILEVDLKAVDSATDEECLTYESTGGDFEWQSCGGGEDAFTAESSPGTTPTATGTDAIGIGDTAVAGNATSDLGALAIGARSTATGINAIAIGENTDATGANSIAIGGDTTDGDSADATAANAIAIGVKTLASGVDSVAIGNRATATDVGQFAYASGYFAAVGDAQTSIYVLRNQTTNATQTELFTNGSSTGISVASDSTVFFRVSIAARRTDVDNESAAYVIEGCIDNNAGTTALVGGLGTKTIVAEDTVAWDVTVTADNTNNEINILVTGEASKTIRWVATVVITTVSG